MAVLSMLRPGAAAASAAAIATLVALLDGAACADVVAHRFGRDAVPGRAMEERFVAFMQEHGRPYEAGSAEYGTRLREFTDRVAAVAEHNAKAGRAWTAGINALADRTPEELASLRGYVHGARADSSSAARGVDFMSTDSHVVDTSKLPKDFNWQELKAMKDVKNQGSCGSCWAVASATVLRAHAELYQQDRTFSVQQIIDCTPNPKACGGTGGCNGATAELAMDYVAKAGAVTEDELHYAGGARVCAAGALAPPAPKLRASAASLSELSGRGGGGVSFGMTGWQKLPENRAEPLMVALYEKGPVVVSVAANSNWNMYSSGVMDACDKDAVINHAVALTGFGEDGDRKYWQIQNSWGHGWGERGFVRLSRQSDAQHEGQYCGWDSSPEMGTGCKGGPPQVKVCGSCGILYDSVVPTFLLSEHGYLHRRGLSNATAL